MSPAKRLTNPRDVSKRDRQTSRKPLSLTDCWEGGGGGGGGGERGEGGRGKGGGGKGGGGVG